MQARIADLARARAPGEWIVTMPLGEPPFYRDPEQGLAEKRWPTRQELDEAAPHNPVYIKAIWGYLAAHAAAGLGGEFARAGAGRDRARHRRAIASIEIERDAAGEPTGIFREQGFMPLVELSLMRAAPGFTVADRVASLPRAAAAYHAFGTTSIYEGHGVAAELLRAYRQVHEAGRLTMRANLVVSPDWRGRARMSIRRGWWKAGRRAWRGAAWATTCCAWRA